MSIKHLYKSVALIAVFGLISRILGFVFRIFLSRVLGAQTLGYYQVGFSIFSVFLTFVSSGLPLTISKMTADKSFSYTPKKMGKKYGYSVDEIKNNPALLATLSKKEKRYLNSNEDMASHKGTSSALLISLIFSLIALVLTIALKPVFINVFKSDLSYNIVLSLIPAVFASAVYAVFRGNLWGKKRFFDVCITELFEQVVRMIICFLLISQIAGSFGIKSPALMASWSLSVACVLSAIYAAILYFKRGGKLHNPNIYLKPVLKSAAPITALRLISSLAMPLLSFIIPLRLMAAGFTESEAIASLGVVMGMTYPLLFLPSTITSSLAMALVPDISSSLKNKTELISKIKASLRFTLIISFILVPVFIAVGEPIGIVLFNNAEAGKLLAQSSFLMVPMGVSGITSSILNSLGLESKSFINYLIGSVFMLACIWFLPPFIGVLSLSVGMGILMTISSLLNIRAINKKINQKTKKDFKTILCMSTFCAISATFGRLMYILFKNNCGIFVSGLIGGLCALISFIAFLIIFKFASLNQILTFRFKRKNATSVVKSIFFL
jgi:stage V sporulation protein B